MSEQMSTGDPGEPTMAELLQEEALPQELRRGDIVPGQIMEIDQDGILVSIGYKSEGMVPAREMRTLTPHPAAHHSIGDTINVYVMDVTGPEGQAQLSIDRVRALSAWLTLEEAERNDTFVTGKVTGHNRGGMVVDLNGLQGFIPLSQVAIAAGADPEAALAARVGEEVSLKIVEVNRKRNRVVLTERGALREQREGLKDQLLSTLQEGDVRHGRVSGISNFGAFVDIGGADGLVHISEISWSPVSNVADVLEVGQEVDVQVLRIDRDNRRIALSLRRLTPTPWQAAMERMHVGQLVTGTITNFADFGAFARVEDGIEGLIHISELTEAHIRHPREVVNIGDTMTLQIVSLDPERHRLGLSLRRVEETKTPTEHHDPVEYHSFLDFGRDSGLAQ